jgi:hypothetical protein
MMKKTQYIFGMENIWDGSKKVLFGTKAYEKILNDFPSHLNDQTALRRYHELIKNIKGQCNSRI